MRVTVGNTLLGTSPDETERLPIGGLVGSGSSDVQEARAKCDGMKRLKKLGNTAASFTLPTVREFSTVSEAQKFLFDTCLGGGVEGPFTVEFADGSASFSSWAVAIPSNLSHAGVLVSATWTIRAGAALS